ncbi:hypothetical protein GCM10027176_41170 [Actinoallomurus bryophytorum]
MDDAVPSKSDETNAKGIRPVRRKSSVGLWTHTDLILLSIGVASSGVAAVVGIAHVPWFVMFLAGSAITCVVALATRAAEARSLKKKVNALWLALTLASAIPVGAFTYHQWFDPSRTDEGSHALSANGHDPQILRPADGPGGSPGYAHGAILGGTTVWVRCYVELQGKGLWYWLDGDGGWVSQADVHVIPGMSRPNIPHCSEDELR